MTTSTNRIQAIFQDARELQADALEMLAQGRIRNAAEKAWGATKRVTDALVRIAFCRLRFDAGPRVHRCIRNQRKEILGTIPGRRRRRGGGELGRTQRRETVVLVAWQPARGTGQRDGEGMMSAVWLVGAIDEQDPSALRP